MKATLILTVLALGLASCAAPVPAATTDAAPASSTAKVAKKKVAAKPKPYPLKTCLVTDDGLDDMDERVSTVYEGQTFEFCCKPCLKKFNKNPGKYVRALAKAKG
ncbi:YHS domain-containing protein [Luteolibacter flavescens]|uniref:YHS domain-containing protein n=1 Tax=Luteolibacter flavescens TaxID=1859460 RepID=A0ABT3FJV8_9BACT|nr:YHS domain-containing protein [Luteolibacter flavescens]MCW1883847.1 YHS domain-containing protein [Luteolibacter flavescens]